MNIIDKIKDKKNLTYLAVLVVGILLGWLIFGVSGENSSGRDSSTQVSEDHDHEEGTIWTCSMHPQIQQDEPGKCPICGMDLIPLEEDQEQGDAAQQYTVRLTDAAMKIAEVSVTRIEKTSPYKEVYLPGRITADERRIGELTARYPGRIEKLNVNFTGQKVWKGQVLAKIYSPELVTAQKELFEAMKYKGTNPEYYQATRNKLKLWDLSEEQINTIEQTGEVEFYFDVLSPLTGTVTMRHVAEGDYVKEGTPLFKVVDLRHVWVIFDAYESDLPWIKLKDKINFRIKSLPGREFESAVTFIDPVIDPKSRVAGVRTELDNPDDLLKPEMLASGRLQTMLSASEEEIVVPKSAILWTGKRAVVYVKTDDRNNLFRYREIELGAEANDYYVVEDGLNEGELVATHGVFKIDAAAQLRGEQSMMNPEGGKVSMAHDHGSMDMGGSGDEEMAHPEQTTSMDEPIDKTNIDPQFKEQLGRVYENYLAYKDALVSSDPSAAKQKAEELVEALENTDMSLLDGNAHMQWMDHLNKMEDALDRISGQEDLEQQRRALAPLSEALYRSIKTFGIDNETVYYQYCPMAIGNKGAYWLSETDEINNPYFGEAMLKCGETRETIR